jgi:hypothetical protein
MRPQEIRELVPLVKTLQLTPDRAVITRGEFALAMHLIVCRTKRGLSALPLHFPRYLFPQLQDPSWGRLVPDDPLHVSEQSSDKHPFDLAKSMGSAFAVSRTHPEKLLGSTSLEMLTRGQVSIPD